eukprot:gene24460-32911_t
MDSGQASSDPTSLDCTLSLSIANGFQDTSSSAGRGVSGNFLEEDDFYSLVYPDEEKSTNISYEYDMEDDSDSEHRATGSDHSNTRRRMPLNGTWGSGSGSGQPQGSEDGSVFIIMQADMDDQDDDTYREEKKEDKIAVIV